MIHQPILIWLRVAPHGSCAFTYTANKTQTKRQRNSSFRLANVYCRYVCAFIILYVVYLSMYVTHPPKTRILIFCDCSKALSI